MNLLSIKAEALATLKAKAFGEAAVGVENFVEAGAGGEINIIDETISLGGQAGVRFAGNGSPVLDGAIIGRNTITVLSGAIYGFALVDLTGPLGPLLEKIMDGLKSLGVDVDGVMNQLSNFSEDARKWVQSKLGGAGKAIGGAVSNLGKKIKKCCKFGGNSLQLEGLKVRYRQDWKTWPGWSDSRDIVNIKLFVGPDGKEQSGDLTTMDSQEAEILKAKVDLEERKLAVHQLRLDAEKRELEFINGLAAFLASPKSQAVPGLSKEVVDTFKKIDEQYQAASSVSQ